MANLGFIGTGAMGEPMARKLLAAGHALQIHDAVAARMSSLVGEGAKACDSAAAVARRCDTVFVMVRDASQVDQAVFGANGAASALTPAHTLVCMSSLPAAYMRDLAGRVEAAVLDAPVSGGTAGAEAAQLAIMVGGAHADFLRIRPLLALMGNTVTHVGGLGSGQTAKAANQIIVAITRAAVAEALLFAARDGADPERVRQALAGGLADSATLATYGPRISGLENPVRFDSPIIRKDINHVVDAAAGLGLDLPFAALARDCYNAWSGDGP